MKSTYGYKLAVLLILVFIMHIFPVKSHAGDATSTMPGANSAAPCYHCKMLSFYHHDDHAFTQGFSFYDGKFYETTGRHGFSSVRISEPFTGKILKRRNLARRYFGEGSCCYDDKIFVLTWTQKTCLLFSVADITPKGQINYSGQGWGLTFGGGRIIQSNGSSSLIFRDPKTFKELYRIEVRDGGNPVNELNELEYVDGLVLANIWHKDLIAAINPETGRVKFLIDISSLRPMAGAGAEVANGIAFDAIKRKLYVTGKLWNHIFEIKWPVESKG